MSDKISGKIFAIIMLAAFTLSNSLLTTVAMENAIVSKEDKPVLRNSANSDVSLKLKGDVSYLKNSHPISISLRDSDVKQVLRMFADKAGMNIMFHESVGGNVTLDLVDVPLDDAFDMVIGITGLNYVVDNKTIIVAKADTKDFNMAKQEMTLIPVKYVSAAAVAEFLNKNVYAINKPGLSSSDIVSTNPSTNELIVFGTKNDVLLAKKVVEQFDKKPKTTTFKVNHTTPAEMANMICSMLLPSASGNSGTATGGAASTDGGGSSSAIALNGGSVACTIDGKLSGGVSSLGLQNLAVAYYSQLGTISVIGGSDHQIEMIKDFIAETDKKQPQAYLEVSIVELNEEGSKELTNTWTIFSKAFSATFDGTSTSTNPLYPMMIKGSGYQLVKIEDEGEIKPLYSVGKYHGPMTISYAINYLVQNGKARVVVNPRIIITNGEESKIEVTQDYLESVEIDSSTSTGGTVVTRDYTISDDQGVTVTITPFISPDGYVTLNIVPEYSTEIGHIDALAEIEGRNPETYRAATLLSHRNLDLKNVRIKDGETLVIAGMIQEKESKSVSKIPVLGDLPIVGSLFRSTTSSKSKSEMVIMLTPKIITDTEDSVAETL